MKIALIQNNIVWGNPEANRSSFESLMEGYRDSGVDLFVLPEMFSTGFVTDGPQGIAEPLGQDRSDIVGPKISESAAWMQRMAASLNAAVAGSISVFDGQKYFNRFYFVRPDGSYAQYDKKHLFSYGGESRFYTPGKARVVVEWRGVRFLLAICYDLRFPVWTRCRGDYDAILYVASWPSSRRQAWDTLLRARAIENQCYVAGVNRTGSDPSCDYDGGSVLADFLGREICGGTGGDGNSVFSGEMDIDALRSFRKKYPFSDDGESYTID